MVPRAPREVEDVPDHLLAHLSPLGWEHVNLTGDYVWSTDQRTANADGYEVRPAEVRPVEVRPVEVRLSEVRLAKVRFNWVLLSPSIPGIDTLPKRFQVICIGHLGRWLLYSPDEVFRSTLT